ncbi:MAG: hypothetical protein ACLQGP_41460 [Isosphaeraceae bacterium]
MRRRLRIGLIVVGLLGVGLGWTLRSPGAAQQKGRDEAQWEYKVSVFSYNPGERLTDERRAAIFEKALNEHARQGWEPVGTLMSRDTIQTVGGAVTTRDTNSFVAYRRRR